jgi:hypothetical protein
MSDISDWDSCTKHETAFLRHEYCKDCRIEKLEALLRVAKCPDNCVSGAVPDGYHGCYQCQFCAERDTLLGDKE